MDGMIWYGMVWHGMAWHGMVWYAMYVCKCTTTYTRMVPHSWLR